MRGFEVLSFMSLDVAHILRLEIIFDFLTKGFQQENGCLSGGSSLQFAASSAFVRRSLTRIVSERNVVANTPQKMKKRLSSSSFSSCGTTQLQEWEPVMARDLVQFHHR